MADKDEALHYLLNKLKSDDGWSGSNLAWNVDKLSVIADMFRALDGAAKVKVLVSFMSMTPRTVNQVCSFFHTVCSWVFVYLTNFVQSLHMCSNS